MCALMGWAVEGEDGVRVVAVMVRYAYVGLGWGGFLVLAGYWGAGMAVSEAWA
jgi:hypothetical protein